MDRVIKSTDPEVWKKIPGYDFEYEISNTVKIRKKNKHGKWVYMIKTRTNYNKERIEELEKRAKRIAISRTQGEWEIIEERAILIGRPNLASHMRSELYKIAKIYSRCPTCVTPSSGEKIRKEFPVYPDIYDALCSLSSLMKIPISTIVDRLILQPLLMPEEIVLSNNKQLCGPLEKATYY